MIEQGTITNAISDHNSIYISLHYKSIDKSNNITTINTILFDGQRFKKEVDLINCKISKNKTNNEQNNGSNKNNFYLDITNAYMASTTTKTINQKKNINKDWINDRIKYLINVKIKLYKKMIKNRNIATETQYKKFKNKLNTIISTTKNEYYFNKINNA